MKKVVSLLLVSITLLSFISCNDNSTDKYTNNGGKDYINISEKNRLVSENSIVIEGIDAAGKQTSEGCRFARGDGAQGVGIRTATTRRN